MLGPMSPVLFVLVGLVIGVTLYALLVRRRAAERFGHISLARALAASNEIGLARIREAAGRRRGASAVVGDATDTRDVVVTDRRSGMDRREADDRRRGRGRRTGSDRRRRWRIG